MIKKWVKRASVLCLGLLIAGATVLGALDAFLPESVTCFFGEVVPTFPCVTVEGEQPCAASPDRLIATQELEYRLFGLLPVKTVTLTRLADVRLYPGGMPFGVRYYTEGVTVVGFSDEESDGNPALAAGLRKKDRILFLDGEKVETALGFTKKIEESGGKELTLTYSRDGEERTTSLRPVKGQDGKFKAGLWVRDSGAGIGTVSFIIPEGQAFAGLGHGICDPETGELMPLVRGSVMNVSIEGVVKGQSGAPGELRGVFKPGKIGTILWNTECGVFGVLSEPPAGAGGEAMPIASRNEIRVGEAYILCTVDGEGIGRYRVEISDIRREETGGKCFCVRVTDKDLIGKTGGIVQGMSGSPVIQDGRIVGAVTHVLVGDPERGYGIFVENMLSMLAKAEEAAA